VERVAQPAKLDITVEQAETIPALTQVQTTVRSLSYLVIIILIIRSTRCIDVTYQRYVYCQFLLF
jgi:hypothetical protein